METSPKAGSADVDLYVLEYIVNMRWLLRYAAHELDPTVEQQYPDFVAQVVQLDMVLSNTAFEHSCTLGDVPFGIVRLAREAVLYLLVSDHLLGGCPPTMHPFLQRAVVAESTSAARRSPRRAPVSADLNVSFPSHGDGDGRDSGVSRTFPELDGRPLNSIDPSSEAMLELAEVVAQGREAQAMLLLLRWLCSEGVLSEDDVLATVEMDRTGDGSINTQANTPAPAATGYEQFRRHQRLACHLAQMVPFYFGAHLLLSRSLLLQYCSTLLTTDAVMRHVAHLRSVVSCAAPRLLAVPPPSSVEGALLEWFQVIVDSINASKDGAVVLARLQDCSALRAFIQHGPFCEDVMDPADRDFFRLVQSGESVCVALLFYYPDAVPLAELSTALRAAENGVARRGDTDAGLEQLHQHLSLCYWTAILAAVRQLGVWTLLRAEEIVRYGRTALPLHLFCLIQQLFAVLATNAEEDVRVSADTAWWEQMKSRDGLTEMMRATGADAGTDAQEWSDKATTTKSSAALSGAQQVLRRSMHDTLLPPVFAAPDASGDGAGTEQVRMGSGHDGWPHERCFVAPPSSTGRATESLDTDECRAVQNGVNVPATGEDDTDGDTTQFSIEVVRTQRGVQTVSGTGPEETLETATSVLRPMVKWRGGALTCTSAAASGTATTTMSLDTLTAVPAANLHDGQRRTDFRAAVFGAHVVDTYARAEEECVPNSRATAAGDLTAQPALVLSELRPTCADALLHTRAVDAVLHQSATAVYAKLPTATTVLVDVPVVTAPAPTKRLFRERDHAESSLRSAGSSYKANRDAPVVIQPAGVSRGTSSIIACAVELSMSSSLTESSDFVMRKAPLDPKEANEAAREISDSGDFSDSKHMSAATTDFQCTTEESPSRQVFAAGMGTGEPTAVLNSAMPRPLLASTTVTSAIIPAARMVLFPTHDAEEGVEDPETHAAAPRRVCDATYADLSSSMGSSPTTRGKATVAAQRSDASAAHVLSSLAPVGGSARSPPKASTSSLPRARDSRSSHSRKCPRVTGIAVEDESRLLFRDEAETCARDISNGRPFSPPPEQLEPLQTRWKDRQTRMAVVDHATVACDLPTPLSHEQTLRQADGDAVPTMTGEDTEKYRALPPSMLSPSPVCPVSSARRGHEHAGDGMRDDNTPHRTVSEGANSLEASPMPLVLTRSLSEVYGTDYALMLEDMAASDVDLLRRRHRTTEESWYSSASWPYHRSWHGAAESLASAISSTQNTAQVRELLDRLTGISLTDLANKDKQELYSALAQQQAVANELKTALHGGRTRVGGRGQFNNATHRPVLRRRKAQLRPPLEETDDRGKDALVQAGRAVRRKPRDTFGEGAGTQRSLMSPMTAESGGSAAHTVQSDVDGQLADTDVSSQVNESLRFPAFTSPLASA
ncbi:conserved hypothetical protein [Leishmania major strain Friedlin]|uniref:Uncharacterized protein n=1 Tax=Leishmania major TaxID=5664 RepID=Q4Q0T9_LEIMA|nr:conserved hypothetical protein [Leishmania major strain Friedlin]CAG9584023.1 hypothetical_protein_-_conserved [Leishmania major strain Friedlin]CAJ09445.1 conserved hypothetical protein [Leishmania major strain Friedlin]|eukprot:XP_001687059.1 conserved hypothetical protein [Leishmania major strain Friedlin]